jgi:hypothetical protein
MTIKQIESQITKRQSELAQWQAMLAKSRTASNIGTRSAHVAWTERELARLKGVLFARHCDEQV